MELLVAIVQDEDADLLSRRLNHANFQHTRLNTVGGFLARGNVTFLAGVQPDRADPILDIIRKTCRTRRRFISPMPAGAEPAHLTLSAPAFPLEVQVGGATIFFVPLKRVLDATGNEVTAMSQVPAPQPVSPDAADVMHLVLTVVQSEEADAVTRALITAGRRVTRINTAGGFLRRGNVTLLVGVPGSEVDDVLRVIRESTQQRHEANPIESGMPIYSATTFVIEASRFVRV